MSVRGVGHVLVVGCGVHGRAVAEALVARGVAISITDDRPNEAQRAFAHELGVPFVASPDADTLRALVAAATEILPTPGLPERHAVFRFAREAAVAVISEFDLADRWDKRPVVAITGTNGKTTVTMMVTAMLERSGRRAMAVGNTDVPLVAALADSSLEIFVVEASSFRLAQSRRFRPAVATWLNFAPDHLDVHASLERYEWAKARIWADQRPDDVAIGPAEDAVVARHLAQAVARQVWIGRPGGYREHDGVLLADDGAVLAAAAELPRSLPHDVSNGLAAAATARAAGANLAAVHEVLTSWQQLPHRVQPVGSRDGITFYDDSKATTPHAVLAAVAGFESVVLIAGGYNKGLDLGQLAATVPRVRSVVAIGAAAAEIHEAFAGLVPVVTAASMNEAVALADRLARAGDAVLLSPGTASFDWYRSYGERGDDFARAVRERLGTSG